MAFNKSKIKRLNIYLTPQDRKKLNEIKFKYHLSYSTIANIILIPMLVVMGKEYTNKYIYQKDEGSQKTSIKPRQDNYSTIVYTNALKLFCRNEYRKFLQDHNERKLTEKEQEKLYQDINNQIYKLFQDTYDPNWDGNELQRRMPKLIKANRQYYKKLLEDE